MVILKKYLIVKELLAYANSLRVSSYDHLSLSWGSYGGLIGTSYGLVQDCFAIGDITGGGNIGGLVGENSGEVLNCYAIGNVKGVGTNVGGLVGKNYDTVLYSYYDLYNSGQNDTGKGIPKNTTEMQTGIPSPSIYTNWSNDVWTFTPTDKYPWLYEPYTYEPTIPRGGVLRHFGDNRYETAVEISKDVWVSADTILLARGDDYADALAGVPLAYQLDAPILLTPTASLHGATKTEIERLGAGQIILLGGTAAISDAVKGELEASGFTVDRIAGENRYETAVEIAKRLEERVDFNTAFIAVGTNYADALAASSYAAIRGEPILLVEKNQIPGATEDTLGKLEIENTYVCGGTAAISNDVLNELPNPTRIFGANRYATALALAEKFLPEGAIRVGIATGRNYPDAIAGGVWSAKNNTGTLLVDGRSGKPDEAIEDLLQEKGIKGVTLFGGTSAISSEMEDWFEVNLSD